MNFIYLPIDVIRDLIISKLDYDAIQELCRTNKRIASICRDEKIQKTIKKKFFIKRYGNRALVEALYQNYFEIADLLLEDLDETDLHSLLLTAIKDNEAFDIELLLKHTPVDPSFNNNEALYMAIKILGINSDIIKQLLMDQRVIQKLYQLNPNEKLYEVIESIPDILFKQKIPQFGLIDAFLFIMLLNANELAIVASPERKRKSIEFIEFMLNSDQFDPSINDNEILNSVITHETRTIIQDTGNPDFTVEDMPITRRLLQNERIRNTLPEMDYEDLVDMSLNLPIISIDDFREGITKEEILNRLYAFIE